ncbi:hypothetical protein DV735_g2080, partial [Chaetothyriales sp. CBS 134920]
MTDFPPLVTPTAVSNPFSVPAVPADQSAQPNGALSDNNGQEEEEYTIKCICSYLDDDGNTVYCPKCDTWQHIECYYPSKKVPEEHYCADCLPRDNLDAKRATERQRRRRDALDGGERKLKRPPSSKAKKKHKDSISTPEQVNGWHTGDRHDSLTNGRDQPPPAKKPKTSHRASGSVASFNGDSRKRATSNAQNYPSPSKSPQDQLRFAPIPLYSPEFLDLYDSEGSTAAQANEVTVQAMRLLSDWRNNPSRIAGPGQQPSNEVPFVRAPPGVDLVANPKVTVETRQRKDLEIGGKIPRWKYVKTNAPLAKDEIIGEIRGEVGLLPEYCLQESTQNRWHELQHPDPFVFFHPHMDIYIDSRKEGTNLKYIRRSCLHNVTLKTLVSEDGDIRHCFAARDEIAAGSELTAAWFLDPDMMLGRRHNGVQEEAPLARQAEWASRVLSNFGDCACPAGAKCLFAGLDRRMPLKPLDAPDKNKTGRKKKPPKGKPAASPTSTGQATNSRAGSEALKQEDEEQIDQHSMSTSTGTDGKSRDNTPVTVAALDADPVLGGDLTAREMRKIKAMERMFEQNGGSKKDKKKRTSGGSNLTTPNPNSKHSPHLGPRPIAADHFSASPPPRLQAPGSKGRPLQPAPPRPIYTSVAVQTDPEEPEVEVRPAKRRKYLTPTQKLLRKVSADRSKWEQEAKRGTTLSPVQARPVEMTDAAAGLSPLTLRSAPVSSPSPSETRPAFSPLQPSAYPLPSQAAHSMQRVRVPSAPKLQLSLLPPVPAFSAGPPLGDQSTLSATFSASALVSTPSSIQSPSPLPSAFAGFANNVATPSPAKKKLTLGDYISRRNTNPSSTPTSDKVTGFATTDGLRKDSTGSATGQEASVSPNVKTKESVKDEGPSTGAFPPGPVVDAIIKEAHEEPEYKLSEGTVDKAVYSTTALTTELAQSAASPPLLHPPSTVPDVLASAPTLHEKQQGQSVAKLSLLTVTPPFTPTAIVTALQPINDSILPNEGEDEGVKVDEDEKERARDRATISAGVKEQVLKVLARIPQSVHVVVKQRLEKLGGGGGGGQQQLPPDVRARLDPALTSLSCISELIDQSAEALYLANPELCLKKAGEARALTIEFDKYVKRALDWIRQVETPKR